MFDSKLENNYLRAGRLVVAPILKAMKSVRDVMVMATPACERATLILSSSSRFCSLLDRVERVWTMTNMSSIPIPRRRKGRTV